MKWNTHEGWLKEGYQVQRGQSTELCEPGSGSPLFSENQVIATPEKALENVLEFIPEDPLSCMGENLTMEEYMEETGRIWGNVINLRLVEVPDQLGPKLQMAKEYQSINSNGQYIGSGWEWVDVEFEEEPLIEGGR